MIFLTQTKPPITTGRPIPSESCKLNPEDFCIANIYVFLKPRFRVYNNYTPEFYCIIVNTPTVNLQDNQRLIVYPLGRCLDPTSSSLPIKIVVTGTSSRKIVCFSIDNEHVSLISLVPYFPFSNNCHMLLPADPPTSSPLTLAYSCPNRILSLPFRSSPSLAKSSSSIRVFGSTKVVPLHLLPSRIYH